MASSPVRRQPSSITTEAALELAADDEDEDVVGTDSDVNTNIANNNATDEPDAEAADNVDLPPAMTAFVGLVPKGAVPTGLSEWQFDTSAAEVEAGCVLRCLA
jgi:hypothetical protein